MNKRSKLVIVSATAFLVVQLLGAQEKPVPMVVIEKVTNSLSNQNPTAPDFDNEDLENGVGVPIIAPGDVITWTYKVTNTSSFTIPKSAVVVTDSVAGVNPVLVDDFDGNDVFSPTEMWLYEATGIAQDLGGLTPGLQPDGSNILPGCNPANTPGLDRNTYNNVGTVTIPGASDSDPSHYCNPPPEIDIEKLTDSLENKNPTAPDFDNEDVANGPGVPIIAPGKAITWTYKVTNTGVVTIPKADVNVTDSVTGVNPVLVDDADGNDLLSPSEMWLYEATGSAIELAPLALGLQGNGSVIVTGCNPPPPTPGFDRNTYMNVGTVTIPGDSDSDDSHYCNPPGRIIIRKITNPPGGTGFAFTDNIEAPNSFNLNHGGSKIFDPVLPGIYQVFEQDPGPDYALVNISCNDPSGGSSTNLGAGLARINLASDETVICTFTNEPPVNGPLLAHWRLLLLGVLLAMAATLGVRIRRHG